MIGRPAPQEAESIRQALEAAWEDPAFTRREPGLLARGLARAQEWVNGILERIFGNLELSEGWAAVLGQVLLWGVLVTGVLILVWLAFELASRVRQKGDVDVGAAAVARPSSTDPDHWEALAREATRQGEWRVGALHLYRAVTLRLAAKGDLRLREGRTPGDYVRELHRRNPALASPFRSFVAQFHPVAFGPGAPGEADWRILEARARPLQTGQELTEQDLGGRDD